MGRVCRLIDIGTVPFPENACRLIRLFRSREERVGDLRHHRTPRAVLAREAFVVHRLQAVQMIRHQPEKWRGLRTSGFAHATRPWRRVVPRPPRHSHWWSWNGPRTACDRVQNRSRPGSSLTHQRAPPPDERGGGMRKLPCLRPTFPFVRQDSAGVHAVHRAAVEERRWCHDTVLLEHHPVLQHELHIA